MDEMKCSLSVCLCYLDLEIWDEMKRSFSVCLSKLDPKISGETKRRFSVRLSDLDTNKRDKLKQFVRPSFVDPILRGEMQLCSYILRIFQLEDEMKRSLSVCLSYVDPSMKDEMTCSLSV